MERLQHEPNDGDFSSETQDFLQGLFENIDGQEPASQSAS
jgi:hypothetical protein